MLSFLNYLRHVSWQTSDSESDTEQFLPLTRCLNVPGPDHFMGKPGRSEASGGTGYRDM